jgi:hypothetical protein
MKQLAVSFLTFGLLLCVLVVTATAVVDIQPPWWRGQISTTSQVWEFMQPTPLVPIPPDGPAPGGQPPLPSTIVIVDPLGPWIPTDPSGRMGIWPLSGRMDVIVDNHNPPNEFKWMWVQLTWQPQDPGEIPILSGFFPEPSPNYPPTIVREEQLPFGWYETTYTWRIYPNPPDEKFTIGGTINVDQLVIDTWCVPEPSTLILLGVGALVMGIYSQRRKLA